MSGIMLCFQCNEFVDYDGGPQCDHTEDEATDADELDGVEIDQTKLEALGKELNRDEPRISKAQLQAEFTSLAARTPLPESMEESQ